MINGKNIHPTAIISDTAIIGENVIIGPYSIIGDNVVIGANNIIKSHVVITGNTNIGDNNEFFSFSCIGEMPQDKKYKGENSKLIIGKNNIIREYVTINPGTEGGGMVTSIGNNCLLMASVHIAHDCKVGDNVIFANNATLAGHVEVADHALLGGLSAVRQFVRIGKYAMIGGMAGIDSDVIPFGLAINKRANLAGINLVGLKRAGFERNSINNIKAAYDILFYGTGSFDSRIKHVAQEYKDDSAIMELVRFLEVDTARAVCKPESDG
ncbi:MAG: acyl-ACP--UDP-N-acetylglucosamine O-acyltransferase [Alphaproteobacteria bacterium]